MDFIIAVHFLKLNYQHLKFQFCNNARVSSDTDIAGYNLTDKCSLDIVQSLGWRLGIYCSNL
jgi:hypothetical protein